MKAGEAALGQAIEQPSTTQPGDGGDDDATDSQARTSQPGVTAADAAARSPLLQTQKCVGAHMLIISLQSHAHAVAALTASAYLLAVSCAHVEPHEHIRTAKCELAPPHSAVRAQLMSSRLTCNETGAQEREAAVACASSPGGQACCPSSRKKFNVRFMKLRVTSRSGATRPTTGALHHAGRA